MGKILAHRFLPDGLEETVASSIEWISATFAGGNVEEKLTGRGRLEDWDKPTKQFDVDYNFTITTAPHLRPGFPPTTRQSSVGKVKSLAGEFIAEGTYRLFRSGGETLKIAHPGLNVWGVLTQS